MLHQVAMVIDNLAKSYETSRPSAMMVLGDVTSTAAAAAAAVRMGIPLIHYEAGLRSHDRTMPEELNRLEADALADAHLVTEPDGVCIHLESVSTFHNDSLGKKSGGRGSWRYRLLYGKCDD